MDDTAKNESRTSLVPCRVVLIGTRIAANLGATARIMRNFGLTDLVLVRPDADHTSPEARKLSTHGEHLLDQARIVDDLGDAVADCLLVVGTSARIGGPVRRQSVGLPDEIIHHLLQAAANGPVALVFGPEPTGLSDEDVARCHYLIHIPTSEEYAALNLAQAVAICLYELRMATLRADSRNAGEASALAAPFAMQERMFTHLRTALEEVHFLYGPNADALMHGLRHLIGRAGPSAMEVNLLFGLARQLRWFAARAVTSAPADCTPSADLIQQDGSEDLRFPPRQSKEGTP